MYKHACNDRILLESKGGASDAVLARKIGLSVENGRRIYEQRLSQTDDIVSMT